MFQNLVKKGVYVCSVVLGIIAFVFFLFHAFAKDPAQMLVGQRADIQTIESIRKDLHLDKPIVYRFLYYLIDLSPISVHFQETKSYAKYDYVILATIRNHVILLKKPYLGRSYQTNEKVWQTITEHLHGTLLLSFLALCVAIFLGVSGGILAAVYKKTLLDYAIQLFTNVGISLPSFFASLIIAWFFGYWLHDYTHLPFSGYIEQFDALSLSFYYDWRYAVLPSLTLGVRPAAIIASLTRSSMIEVLQEDYIRTAKAKGLSNFRILFKHALRNALNPVVSAISNWLASLIAGAFFVEYVFSWKGIGYLTVQAMEQQDFPVLMGVVLVLGVFFVLINFFTDIAYQWIDPRVRV
ncbi:MAG: ABC transporter permease [Bacteroidia bacterium]|nr:ABC transporter permease [Bacteroidia bacterium]MDW8301134.1 ABC transporter permease [Bacteroidia bacterium]